MASDEESASDTEHDKELLFEVEYLNVSEMSLKDDNTLNFEKGQTSKQAEKIIRCCGKHSIRKHRPRSEVDVPDGKVPCNVCFALFPNKFTAAMHKRGKNSVQPLMKCKFCGCNFFTKKGMIKHRRQFHKGQRHKCCRCSFSSKDKNELIEHSISHKTNSNEEERAKAYQCKLCDSRFQLLQERRLHERLPYRIRRKKRTKKVSEEATVPANWCCGCGRVFSSISELNAHQNEVHLPNRLEHNEENPIECVGCYKRFKTDNILKQHLRKNATRKRFFCDKCTAVRLSPEEMIQHQLSHTGKNAFLCCGCKMQFESNEQLEQHALQEHANRPKIYYNDEDDTERPFPCKVCYRRYKSLRDLRGHQRFVYSVRNHTCEICGKSFRHVSSLTLHIASHKTKAEFPCPICGNKYKHERQVRFCMIRHERPREHKCKICNVTFTAAANLYSHMVSHSDSRPYKCNICGVTYKRSFHLRKHMDVHSDKKHYPCKYCPAEFFSTSELYKHEISHTGVYPYECEICSKKLCTRLVYIKHYEAHIEDSEKVFVCHLCPKKFSLDHFLSNHIKYKHRIEPQDKQWNKKFNRKGPARLKGGRRLRYTSPNAPLARIQQARIEINLSVSYRIEYGRIAYVPKKEKPLPDL
ncbi:zinc finger protein 883 [Aedes albopictus]|uniref:C2H2-type domain-containing protein n=1 Tax=Aedes albopictus TaxID=7160 RepID=A0ABM1Y1I4_AEDAL